MKNNIGATIKELRKRSGMSQQELADKLNTTNFTISKWENNITTPDIYYLKNISKIFKITIDDLMNNNIDKRNTDKTKIIAGIAVIELIIIIVISAIAINNNKITIQNLSSTNNDISLKGILIANKSVSLLEINNIEYVDKNTGTDLETIPEFVSIIIKANKDTIINKNIENTDKESIYELLKKTNISYQSKNKIKDLSLIIKYHMNNKQYEITTMLKP